MNNLLWKSSITYNERILYTFISFQTSVTFGCSRLPKWIISQHVCPCPPVNSIWAVMIMIVWRARWKIIRTVRGLCAEFWTTIVPNRMQTSDLICWCRLSLCEYVCMFSCLFVIGLVLLCFVYCLVVSTSTFNCLEKHAENNLPTSLYIGPYNYMSKPTAHTTIHTTRNKVLSSWVRMRCACHLSWFETLRLLRPTHHLLSFQIHCDKITTDTRVLYWYGRMAEAACLVICLNSIVINSDYVH